MKKLSIVFLGILTVNTYGAELNNHTLRLFLDVAPDGIAVIKSATWAADNETILKAVDDHKGLEGWWPSNLIPAEVSEPIGWHISESPHFLRAQAQRNLVNGLKKTWIVELPKQGSMFRMYVQLINNGSEAKAVEQFPGWRARWRLAEKPTWARWWKALSYHRNNVDLKPGEKVSLGARLHSSDSHHGGATPYWIVGGDKTRIHFALAWCGGWKAYLENIDNCIDFAAWLPANETQLVLRPGETITGPMMYVTVTKDADEAKTRSSWMLQRSKLAGKLYGGPPIRYPFHYNHWYSSRFAVDGKFLQQQVDSMDPYGFDSFVVDAGWYEKMGLWNPETKRFSWHQDPKKFKPGQFAEIMLKAKKKGAVPGIWTAPQLVNSPNKETPPYIKDPVNYNRFSRGFVLDMAALDFTSHLTKHIKDLRDSYHCGWWKYDQGFFYEKSQTGVMKNVDAFQKALLAVRAANPDLHIEGCMGGGRMINELTLLATQSHWLLDGGHTGLNHARQNVVVALGSLDFVFPWAATRWMNNPNKNDHNDDEFTRFYCRSCMAGIWGISADLSLIGERQRAVIVKEIQNYRRLNKLKNDCLYDLYLPGGNSGIAGITYYKASGLAAGILLYRWDRNGEFEYSVGLSKLNPALQYRVENVDSGQIKKMPGRKLHDQGLTISFKPHQQSVLVFIEPISPTG